MNSPQHSLAPASANGFEARGDLGPWSIDEDIPLGCECANPALQIERWGQEAPVRLHESY